MLTEASAKIVQNSPQHSGKSSRRPDGSNATNKWQTTNEVDIEPIDVLVPVVEGDFGVGDVRFLASFEFWACRSGLCSHVHTG
jgi:hypothetical protein